MKVCVFGLWHLGAVTAACVADYGIETIGLDPDPQNIANLGKGMPPLFEPGLPELVARGLQGGRLSFTVDPRRAVGDADVVWVCFDTPVNDDDIADTNYVRNQVEGIFPHLRDGAMVLISAQMPVGSTAALEKAFAAVAQGRQVDFACSPENLRLGKAIEVFTAPGRIVVGVRRPQARQKLEPLLARICDRLIWVGVESAEMTKHALNAFLATCVTFANEIATVCEAVGADAQEVEGAIRSDPRVGNSAYVRPGASFAGGTLARDVRFLESIAGSKGLPLHLLRSVLPSNAENRHWAYHRAQALLGGLKGRRVAVLGLAYKPGTNTLRRSIAMELCGLLAGSEASVVAFDPEVKDLPSDMAGRMALAGSVYEALAGADAVILATEWPDFRALDPARLAKTMARPLVLDQPRFLEKVLRGQAGIEYVTIGTKF